MMPDTGYKMPDTGCQIPDARYQIPDKALYGLNNFLNIHALSCILYPAS